MKYKSHLFIILSSFFLWSSLYAQTPLINELFSRGTAVEPDWIEIYNPSSSSIDITGYKIYDNGGKNGTKPKKEFPSGSVIPAQGFLVIITDDADPSGFGLSSGGEWVWFENTTGTVIDSVNMAAVTDPEASYGRLPDGSANWQILIPRTRGTSNTIIVVTPVINELFSRGTEIEPDWIEIYNPSSLAMDISGYKIYDNGGKNGTKPKKEFPAGSVIPANEFLVIITDDADPSGFGLSSGGEWVWFEDTTGTVIDSVNMAAVTDPEASYGRLPDGSENWQILIPRTRGYSNVPVTSSVVINELFSRGTEIEPDWIEIYNTTSSSIDITGYKIYDNGGKNGTKPKKEFPAGSVIPANGFLVIITDDADPSGFGLSSGGEWVWFENTTGTVVDSVNMAAITDTAASYGRLPDGSANWQILIPRTRGYSNSTTDVEDEIKPVSEFKLFQNYPNPFNPSTKINFSLTAASKVKLTVYNLLGQVINELVNGNYAAGNHTVSFDAVGLNSGIYFYKIEAVGIDGQNFTATRKMILIK